MSTVRQLLLTTTLLVFISGFPSPVVSQEAVRLTEDFAPGHSYRVSATLTIQGRVALPPEEKDKPPKIIDMTGASKLVYDERILPPLDSGSLRTLRTYREADFHRVQGTLTMDAGLRPSIRRMVFLRNGIRKVRFSPDGPLTWDEIDLLRTDVFCPVTIPGILPIGIVQPGQTWRISPEAIAELTDLEKVESGELTVKFVAIATINERRTAKLAISGTVRGVNEDGPNRQSLEGSTAYFDLDSRMLSYLSLKGSKEMLDGRGQVVGRTEGQYTMTRSVGALPSDMTDAALRGLELRPTAENTLLLYDNPSLGVRFLHPRTWRVGTVQGRQITVEQPYIDGGILITVEAAAKLPSAEEYQKEIGEFLKTLKARDVRPSEPITRLRAEPPLDRFAIDSVIKDVPSRTVAGILKQTEGGATVSITVPGTHADQLATEIERILRSLSITRTIEAK